MSALMSLQNVFSWSKSRDGQFRECQRKYYFDKYASWGGWDRGASKPVRDAYVLKNLKNRWAWKGETVHHEIEHVLKSLRSARPVKEEEALAHLTETMRKNFRSSKQKRYWEDPKHHVGLFEHEYQKEVTDATWKSVHREASQCLANFYGSGLYKELITDNKENWLVIEDLEDFEFEGAKIFVKLDFARKKEGLVEIYDWKTGKTDTPGAGTQLGAYAIYAMGRWGVPLESIRAYLVNLAGTSAAIEAYGLDEALIEETKKVMRESIASMQAMLQDVPKNIPLPKERFSFAKNERFCNFCNFYKICEKFN